MTNQTRSPARQRPSGASLARKRYALRLPLALASRLEALCEMHPQAPRSQLIADLIGLGLAQVERRAQAEAPASAPPFYPDIRQPIYLLTGPFSEFHGLTYKHHLAMEREFDESDPHVLPGPGGYELGDAG